MSIIDRPAEWRRWYGRKLFLAKSHSTFYCGGFYVNRVNPVALVNEQTQVNQIITAVQKGILIDITDNNQGLIIDGIGHSIAKTEDTGKKVYFTTTTDGGLAIKAADTPEEIARCEDTIKKTGVIVPQDYKVEPPIGADGRVQPGQESILLHGLNELVEQANTKVYGPTPTIKPGPIKTG
jgi:hypothetical protein